MDGLLRVCFFKNVVQFTILGAFVVPNFWGHQIWLRNVQNHATSNVQGQFFFTENSFLRSVCCSDTKRVVKNKHFNDKQAWFQYRTDTAESTKLRGLRSTKPTGKLLPRPSQTTRGTCLWTRSLQLWVFCEVLAVACDGQGKWTNTRQKDTSSLITCEAVVL